MASNNETVAGIIAEVRTINPGNEYADRILAAHNREIAELRECLKEAIREKCPFTRMSCKHGEQCDYECGTKKWRNALKGSNNATK